MFDWLKRKPGVAAASAEAVGAATWREDPHLRARFHPDYPDDLEVLVHDGEPRRTGKQIEKCWVRVIGAFPGPTRRMIFNEQASPLTPEAFRQRYESTTGLVFNGTLLNAPVQLSTIRQGDELLFISGPGLDPPTVMAQTRFPDQQGSVEGFTSFCPLGCKGQLLFSKSSPDD